MERIGNAKIVLLGEASHGTHEYYTWRSAISRRLIEEKGFNFVGVEGDWPDCYRVNRYIKGYDQADQSAQEVIAGFNRWPTWMWANWEVASFITWLRDYNTRHTWNKKTGFYGLDVYSLWESMEAMVEYLSKNDPAAARIAEKALGCFSAYGKDEQNYAVNALSSPCRDEVVRLLKEIRKKAMMYDHDPEAMLNTTQNAYVAVEAEKYYRNMVAFDEDTWNIRDRHMMETLKRLLEFYGNSKAIVWEHNTHIGDARYTDMKKAGLFNIGQLAREQFGDDQVVLVGFGSYEGSVIAGRAWGAPMQEMQVPPAKIGSVEEILHRDSEENKLIIFNKSDSQQVLPHRAIGVVYHPEREAGNYVPSVMSQRYDAFIYIDRTTALHPLHIKPNGHEVPETYPFNV